MVEKKIPHYKYFNKKRYKLEMFAGKKSWIQHEAKYQASQNGMYTRIVKTKHEGKTVYVLYLRRKPGWGD